MPQELQKCRPCARNVSLNRLAEERSPLTPDECLALQKLADNANKPGQYVIPPKATGPNCSVMT
jgi:hypothetical protein